MHAAMCLHNGACRLQLLRCSRTADDADMTVDILIFHHTSTRSVRVVWLCEELGLKYDLDVITVHIAVTTTDVYTLRPDIKVHCHCIAQKMMTQSVAGCQQALKLRD